MGCWMTTSSCTSFSSSSGISSKLVVRGCRREPTRLKVGAPAFGEWPQPFRRRPSVGALDQQVRRGAGIVEVHNLVRREQAYHGHPPHAPCCSQRLAELVRDVRRSHHRRRHRGRRRHDRRGTEGAKRKALTSKDASSQSVSGSYAVHGCYCAHTCATLQY